MQAIQTKYHGPTNTRGSRVSASCARGRISVEWNDAFISEQNHVRACELLCAKFCKEDAKKYGSDEKNPWGRKFVTGGLKDGSCVHVFIE